MDVQQIHEFRSTRSRFGVAVRASFLHEVLHVLWSALGGDDKLSAHDLGKRWFDDVRRRIPADLLDEMAVFGGDHGSVWLTFVDWIASAPDLSEPDEALRWLAGSDYRPFKHRSLDAKCGGLNPAVVDRAVAGDEEAIESCLAEFEPAGAAAFERWFHLDPAEVPSRVTAILRRVMAEVLTDVREPWQAAYRVSVAAVESEAAVLEPADLIEEVTNGISYEIPLGMRRLELIPSMSLRPWTIVTESEDTLYVFYPVSDRHLDADPSAPPAWLVRYHKALGDERRLRMLRRLAEGPAGLAELTEAIGLAKSTVFHHIGVLRGAGLVRVHLAPGKSGSPVYDLRRGVVDTAARAAKSYLEAEES